MVAARGMPAAEVIRRSTAIIGDARKLDPLVPDAGDLNFLARAQLTRDIVKGWGTARREGASWLRPMLLGMSILEGDFQSKVDADPMILYHPAHEVALAFHMSPAKVRYNRSANRTSKSQTGYAEHYLVATGSHPYRQFLHPPTASFVVGVNFSKYGPAVFEAKLFTGEAGNTISPMFPEGGKWLYKYDDRKHVGHIACAECAEAGKAQSCKHPKSIVRLFSDTEGTDVLQGAQYNLGHFDEHVREDFFDEGMERLKTVAKSSLIITGTPLLGKSSWEHQRLTSLWMRGEKENRVPGTDLPYVSVHTIDQYAAGLVAKEDIDASKLTMDPLMQESRIYGRPAPLARHSVFDRWALHEMDGKVEKPFVGRLDGDHKTQVEWRDDRDGAISIWSEPVEGEQYVIGCDVAAGLTGGDYSCASVIQIPDLRLVAQYHGHVNPLDYAVELAKLGAYYDTALVVVERNSVGSGTIHKLREIGYPYLFRDKNDPAQAIQTQDSMMGIDTNVRSKAHMVSCLQQVIREREIHIPCAATLEELMAYGQETTASGMTVRLRGEGSTHDDRVMSIVLAVYVAVNFPVFNFGPHMRKLRERHKNENHPDPIWKDVHRELRVLEKGKTEWTQ